MSTIYHIALNDIPSKSITDKCIVLDLDQTVISTQDSIKSLHELKILSDPQLISIRNRIYYKIIDDLENPGSGLKYDFWGLTRPHIYEFLIFCFSYFKIVAIWSAGKRQYVESIVDHIFRDLPYPHVIFTYDDIVIGPDRNVEKPLIKMINSSSFLKQNMSLQNILVIDDIENTFRHNNDNGILIPAYEPKLSIEMIEKDDASLLQLKDWLLQPKVINSLDVSMLDKNNIFSNSY